MAGGTVTATAKPQDGAASQLQLGGEIGIGIEIGIGAPVPYLRCTNHHPALTPLPHTQRAKQQNTTVSQGPMSNSSPDPVS